MNNHQLSRREYLKLLGAGAAAAAVDFPSPAAPPAAESQAERDRRMKWWRDARFGMFIHWGLYAIPAGEWKGKKTKGIGEWIMNDLQIPLDEYTPLVKQFNPVKYDAREWVRIAKDAGMKYIVITSKHHDGFALWDSKVSDYDVMATPYRRDLLKPLADECRRQGLRFCTYHSIMDWHHPDYLPRRKWDARPTGGASLDRYVAYMKAQLKEIVTNYDPGVMWFDGEWEETWTHERGVDLDNYVRSLNPKIIVNNRVDKGRKGMQGLTKEGDFRGDFGTPEQEIPPEGLPGVDWESCMTMNDTWGYRSDDHKWKSSERLIRNLVDIASKGGNFLLNVGPTAEGLIPGPSVERLAAMGKWMKVNSQAIYGTAASPIGKPAWGRATQKPGKLYLHVFEWPGDGKLTIPVTNQVTKASLLAEPGRALTATASDRGVTIQLPPTAPDPVASVIALDIKGAPQARG
jgi:alpha-L-fucosidase